MLELGSGTGLVGLTAAAILFRSHRVARVVLSDFDTDALSNLQHNVKLNSIVIGDDVTVERLDWGTTSDRDGRYDVILGADLCFEPQHALLLHRAVSTLLAFPTSRDPDPVFELVLPLRRTHQAELDACDRAFGSCSQATSFSDLEGRRWTLQTRERTEESAGDGFGDKGDGVSRYWVYRIEWAQV